jgi:hydrogenase maturation factor
MILSRYYVRSCVAMSRNGSPAASQHAPCPDTRATRNAPLSLGKLPQELLAAILSRAPIDDPRVILGPGIGLDCAVIDTGERLTVYKSDPVTFATDQIGYYLVQVNANDIATTGARPLWLLVTLLLPEKRTPAHLPERIMAQVQDACRGLGVVVIGGHTEITAGLDRPIAIGTMIGEVARDKLISPRGARVADRVLLTKGVPIEATALLSREFPAHLRAVMTQTEIEEAQGYLFEPGIGVTRDARAAIEAGRVTAMHDPTEGGIATALWELAEASQKTLQVDPAQIMVPALARRVCEAFGIDPFSSIASGALLITAPPAEAQAICHALHEQAIACADIGVVANGPPAVQAMTATGLEPWPRPALDGITKAFGA